MLIFHTKGLLYLVSKHLPPHYPCWMTVFMKVPKGPSINYVMWFGEIVCFPPCIMHLYPLNLGVTLPTYIVLRNLWIAPKNIILNSEPTLLNRYLHKKLRVCCAYWSAFGCLHNQKQVKILFSANFAAFLFFKRKKGKKVFLRIGSRLSEGYKI